MQHSEQLAQRNKKCRNFVISELSNEIVRALDSKKADNFFSRQGREFFKQFQTQAEQKNIALKIYQDAIKEPEIFQGAILAISGFIESNKKHSFVNDIFEDVLITQPEKMVSLMRTVTIADFPFKSDGTLDYILEEKRRDSVIAEESSRLTARNVFTVKLNGRKSEPLYLSTREGTQGEVRGKRLVQLLELEHQKSLQRDYAPRTLEQIIAEDPATQKAERTRALSTLEGLVLNQTQAADWELQEGVVSELSESDLMHFMSLVNDRLAENARDTKLTILYAPLTKDELIEVFRQGVSLRDLQQENSLPKKMITEYGYDRLLDDNIVDLFEAYSDFYQKDESFFDEMQKINIFDNVHQGILSQIWQLSQRHRHEPEHQNAQLSCQQIQALFPFLASSLGQCNIANCKTEELIALGSFIGAQLQLSSSLAEFDSLLSTTKLPDIKTKLDAAKKKYLENPIGEAQQELKQAALALSTEAAGRLGQAHFGNNKIQRELQKIPHIDFTPNNIEPKFFGNFVQKAASLAAFQQEQLIISLQSSIASVMAESLARKTSLSPRSPEAADLKLKQVVSSLFEDNVFEGPQGQQLLTKLMSSPEQAYMGVSDGFFKIGVVGQGSNIALESGMTTKESVDSDASVDTADIMLTSPSELKLKLKKEAIEAVEKIFETHQAEITAPTQTLTLSQVFEKSSWFSQQDDKEAQSKVSPLQKSALDIVQKVKEADKKYGQSVIAENFHENIDLQRLQLMASIASTFPHRDIVGDLFSATERQGQERNLRENLSRIKVTDLPFDSDGKLQYQRDRENSQLIINIYIQGRETVLRFDDRATANELRGMAVVNAFEQAYARREQSPVIESLDSALRSSETFKNRNISAVVRPLERVAIEDYQDFCTQIESKPLQMSPEVVQALIPALEREFQRPICFEKALELVQSHQEVLTEKTIAERKEFYLASFTSEQANEIYDRNKAYEVFEKYGSFYKNSPLFSYEAQSSVADEQHDKILPLLWRLSQQNREDETKPELTAQQIEQLFPIIAATNGAFDVDSIDERTLQLFTRLDQQSEATMRSEVLMLLEYSKNPASQSLSQPEQNADRLFIKNQKNVFQILESLQQFIERYAQSSTESFNQTGKNALEEARQQLLDSQKAYIADGDLEKLRSTVESLYQGVKAQIQTERTYQWASFLHGLENIWRSFKKYFWPQSHPSLMAQTNATLRALAAQEAGKPTGDYSALEQLLKSQALEGLSSAQQLDFKAQFLQQQAPIIEHNRTAEVGQALAQAEEYLVSFVTTSLPELLASPAPLAELFTKEQIANNALSSIKEIACSDITEITSNKAGSVVLHLKSGETFEMGSEHAFHQVPELRGLSLTELMTHRPEDGSTLEAFLEKILLEKRIEGALNAVIGTIAIDIPVLSGADLVARLNHIVQRAPEDTVLSLQDIKLVTDYLKSLSTVDKASLGSLATAFEPGQQPTSCDLKKLYLFTQYENGSYRQERDQCVLARSIHTKEMSQNLVDLYLSQNEVQRAAIPERARVSIISNGCKPSIGGVTSQNLVAILTKPQQDNNPLSEEESQLSAGLKKMLQERSNFEKISALQDSYSFARANKFDKEASWQSMRNIIFDVSVIDSAQVDLFKIFSEIKLKDVNRVAFKLEESQKYLALSYQDGEEVKVLQLSARDSANGEVRGQAIKTIIEQAIATVADNPSLAENSLKDIITSSQRYQEYTDLAVILPLYAAVIYNATELFEEKKDIVSNSSLLGKIIAIEEVSKDSQQRLQKLAVPYYAFSAEERNHLFDVLKSIYECECSIGAALEPYQMQRIMQYVVSQDLTSIQNTERSISVLKDYLTDFSTNLRQSWVRDASLYLSSFSGTLDKNSVLGDIEKVRRIAQLANALTSESSQDAPLNIESPVNKALASIICAHVLDNRELSSKSLKEFAFTLRLAEDLKAYVQPIMIACMARDWERLGENLDVKYSPATMKELQDVFKDFNGANSSPYNELVIEHIISYVTTHKGAEHYKALRDTDLHLLKQLSYIQSEIGNDSHVKESLEQAINSFVQRRDLSALSVSLERIQVTGPQKDLWQKVSANIHTAAQNYPESPEIQRRSIAAKIEQQSFTKVWPPLSNPSLQAGAAVNSFLSQNSGPKNGKYNR